jgi:NADPH:quinone reductase-like Zn-dependent oxidoreductase
MRAAWYEKQGPAREVLVVGEMPDPGPGPSEVRIRIAASGINPGDIKKRQDSFGVGMPYPRVIPHSDGAGRVDQVGEGVSSDWAGRCGVMAPNPTVRSAPPLSSRWCRWIMWLSSRGAWRRSRALVWGYLASRPIALSMSGATWRDGPCWYKGPEARLECVRQRSRVTLARA